MIDMELHSLGDYEIHSILGKLCSRDVAAIACVNHRLFDLAAEDFLWLKFCSEELNLHRPLDPTGIVVNSFKEAYYAWRTSFILYPWAIVKRVKHCWDNIKSWLHTNFPECGIMLRPGATEAEISEFESNLKLKLPLPTRILYRFCDGQEIPSEGTGPESISAGLLGGYSFYEHKVNVFLLSLKHILLETKRVKHQLGFLGGSKYVIVAASFSFVGKYFLLNCANGQLYVGTCNLILHGEMLPCVPKHLINLVNSPSDSAQQDAMLLWLEEHGRRLNNGIIGVRKEDGTKHINLFPEASPLCSVSVTNGVQVRASAVFVPEMSDLPDKVDKYLFAYSIRMCLLPSGCEAHGMTFTSCQLCWRHWLIRSGEVVVSNINGEAVIGKYPLLVSGMSEFVYQSCTHLQTDQGCIEGSFTFVPGRVNDQKGELFEAMVAPFPLRVPDYIF